MDYFGLIVAAFGAPIVLKLGLDFVLDLIDSVQ